MSLFSSPRDASGSSTRTRDRGHSRRPHRSSGHSWSSATRRTQIQLAAQVEALETRQLLSALVTTNKQDYAPGSTAINGGAVTTTGAQTYGDAVSLGGNTTLTSTGAGNVSFGSSVNGAHALAVTGYVHGARPSSHTVRTDGSARRASRVPGRRTGRQARRPLRNCTCATVRQTSRTEACTASPARTTGPTCGLLGHKGVAAR